MILFPEKWGEIKNKPKFYGYAFSSQEMFHEIFD